LAAAPAGRRTIIIAGAGIGGLTAALALAQKGIPTVILESASRLQEIGAGIQLSPNASRILIDLGLGGALAPHLVAPTALHVVNAKSGHTIAKMTLGAAAQERYGAPFCVLHRGDLQRVLLGAVHANPLINLRLGTAVVSCSPQPDGVTVGAMWRDLRIQENGAALIGADGLRSVVRTAIDASSRPSFSGYSAWRATVPADVFPKQWSRAEIHLWLGRGGHLVHYPVRGRRDINLVAIVKDETEREGWDTAASGEALLGALQRWTPEIRSALSAVPEWKVWSLYELPALDHWSDGPITLLGDAAHAMLPFLAQGAAMAIEDAAMLADCIAGQPGDISTALRAYEQQRRPRADRVVRAARMTGMVYRLGGPMALARNLAMRMMGDERLRSRYDWIYGWKQETRGDDV
jgi:salicylate hydroxylase